mmetsp:Transcript_27895/g.47145  ORF Transcript_27895/g.47145 Transcript_27895/m.47145 type:complete len:253 (+) Transcript_27895:1563-2321(+)
MLIVLGASVDIRVLDHLKHHIGHTALLGVNQRGVEQRLRSLKPLTTDLDHTSVRKGIVLHETGGFLSQLALHSDIMGDIAHLLLNLAHSFEICGAVESITSQQQELDEVVGHVTARHIETTNEILRYETIIDGNHMCHSITRVHHNSGQQTLRVQCEHRLDGDVASGELIGLEHLLDEGLAVLRGVHGGLGEQDLVVARVDLQLFKKCVVPQVFHVFPVLDDTALHRVVDVQRVSHGSCLVATHHLLQLYSF